VSVHGDLFDWSVAELRAAAVLPSASIAARQRPCWLKGDPDPWLVVSPGPYPETQVGRQTGGVVTLGFPVLVVYATQQAALYRDPVNIANVRAAIRAVMLKLKPLDYVRLGLYDPAPVVDMAGFPQGFDISPQLFVYHGNEHIPE